VSDGTKKTDLETLKKNLVAAQALIKFWEDLSIKARPRMNKEEIRRYDKLIYKLRKEESLLIDAIFRSGGKLQ
jgi:hypothetical protein